MSRKLGDKIAEAILAQHTTSKKYESESECWDVFAYDEYGYEQLVCTHVEDAEIARSFT